MRLRFEPNEEQQGCPHENQYCSFAGEGGTIYTCPDCDLEWEEDNGDEDFNEDELNENDD